MNSIYRVARDQTWDTEQFTGIELQKKYRISRPQTETFTEQLGRFIEIIQNFPSTYRTVYRKKMSAIHNSYVSGKNQSIYES